MEIRQMIFPFNPSSRPVGREKIKLNFFFTLLCGASKAFMKRFEAAQRSVKIEI